MAQDRSGARRNYLGLLSPGIESRNLLLYSASRNTEDPSGDSEENDKELRW